MNVFPVMAALFFIMAAIYLIAGDRPGFLACMIVGNVYFAAGFAARAVINWIDERRR